MTGWGRRVGLLFNTEATGLHLNEALRSRTANRLWTLKDKHLY